MPIHQKTTERPAAVENLNNHRPPTQKPSNPLVSGPYAAPLLPMLLLPPLPLLRPLSLPPPLPLLLPLALPPPLPLLLPLALPPSLPLLLPLALPPPLPLLLPLALLPSLPVCPRLLWEVVVAPTSDGSSGMRCAAPHNVRRVDHSVCRAGSVARDVHRLKLTPVGGTMLAHIRR
jgi:hypothetical protein